MHSLDPSPQFLTPWFSLSAAPQCPVTCGGGRSTRQVVCSNYHQPVDQSFCDPDEKPATEQDCTAAPCSSIYHRQRINDQPYGYPQDPGRHPGHSSWNVPSADNQWRTGPWGAVCSACDVLSCGRIILEITVRISIICLSSSGNQLRSSHGVWLKCLIGTNNIISSQWRIKC